MGVFKYIEILLQPTGSSVSINDSSLTRRSVESQLNHNGLNPSAFLSTFNQHGVWLVLSGIVIVGLLPHITLLCGGICHVLVSSPSRQ